jgi:hypothetical protein
VIFSTASYQTCRYAKKKTARLGIKKNQNAGDTKKRGLIRLLSTAAFAAGTSHFSSWDYIGNGIK